MDKRFSGQEVFEMAWAALAAIDTMRNNMKGTTITIEPSVIADHITGLLETGASPVGLRVSVTMKSPGEWNLDWRWNQKQG